MTSTQANLVAAIIESESCLQPIIGKIGNGEYVVLLRHDGSFFYLWSLDDWKRHKEKWTISLREMAYV